MSQYENAPFFMADTEAFATSFYEAVEALEEFWANVVRLQDKFCWCGWEKFSATPHNHVRRMAEASWPVPMMALYFSSPQVPAHRQGVIHANISSVSNVP